MNTIARCVEAAGGARNGLLLFRVAYWHPRARVELRGRTWVAKGYREWAEETGLSERACMRAMTELRERGLVETETSMFRDQRRLLTRLSADGERVVSGSEQRPGRDRPLIPKLAPPSYQNWHHPHTKTGTISYTLVSSLVSCRDSRHDDTPPGEDMNSMKARDVVGGRSDSRRSLEAEWKCGVHEATGQFVPPLTGQERGQLKRFAEKCPDGEAVGVLRKVLEDWSSFARFARSNEGAFNVPATPKTGFLLKYARSAVAFEPEIDYTSSDEVKSKVPYVDVDALKKAMLD